MPVRRIGLMVYASILASYMSRCNAHVLDQKLLDVALRVSQKFPSTMPSLEDLAVSSAYSRHNGKQRGFCNWVLPGKIMVGQYPGQNPEKDGPSQEDVDRHIRTMVEGVDVSLFCCLQSEVPAQTDMASWDRQNGQVFLDFYYQNKFPHPFLPYAPLVQELKPECQFLHHPIEDLNVPTTTEALEQLLLDLLVAIDNDQTIYIHCWGGRGRAGLVASCLMSLIHEDWTSDQILGWVQAGYDTRLGAKDMPLGLQRSPQTSSQRAFVRDFVKKRQQMVR